MVNQTSGRTWQNTIMNPELTTLCSFCTLSSAMRDCAACQAWTRAIGQYVLKPVKAGNGLKPVKAGLSIKQNTEFSKVQLKQKEI